MHIKCGFLYEMFYIVSDGKSMEKEIHFEGVNELLEIEFFGLISTFHHLNLPSKCIYHRNRIILLIKLNLSQRSIHHRIGKNLVPQSLSLRKSQLQA